jgi:hypothetical protein
VTLEEALVDVAKRFFAQFDEQYFIKKTDELQEQKKPAYIDKLSSEKYEEKI